MVKKPSLSAALQAASKKPTPTLVPPVEKPQAQRASAPQQVQIKPSRVGKKPVTGYFDPAVSRQIKQMALDQDSSIQDLMREAFNDLFEKHNQKPIA